MSLWQENVNIGDRHSQCSHIASFLHENAQEEERQFEKEALFVAFMMKNVCNENYKLSTDIAALLFSMRECCHGEESCMRLWLDVGSKMAQTTFSDNFLPKSEHWTTSVIDVCHSRSHRGSNCALILFSWHCNHHLDLLFHFIIVIIAGAFTHKRRQPNTFLINIDNVMSASLKNLCNFCN